ncbi:hypothetical protein Ptr86124_003519 [Pyrenophora tritici-repentis]|uniref:Uncharacterized protein n=1 Tax=Pyrenophora tritici-repentis TaxID=45151 RepID=A0A922T2W0_9PLEO|nr:hypothetical protein Ptr86124_003519 [Pyrenophora tritici-repentis]
MRDDARNFLQDPVCTRSYLAADHADQLPMKRLQRHFRSNMIVISVYMLTPNSTKESIGS